MGCLHAASTLTLRAHAAVPHPVPPLHLLPHPIGRLAVCLTDARCWIASWCAVRAWRAGPRTSGPGLIRPATRRLKQAALPSARSSSGAPQSRGIAPQPACPCRRRRCWCCRPRAVWWRASSRLVSDQRGVAGPQHRSLILAPPPSRRAQDGGRRGCAARQQLWVGSSAGHRPRGRRAVGMEGAVRARGP